MNLSARRLTAASAVSALVLGGLALSSVASAAGICPTYTDPAGDAAAVVNMPTPDGQQPLTNSDDDLDILDVSHSVEAGVFTTVVHVKALSDAGPAISLIDRFTAAFTVNGKAASVEVVRDFSDPQGNETTTGTLLLGTTVTPAKVTVVEDYKASTVTAKIAAADVSTALGGDLTGKPFSAMTAKAAAIVGAQGKGAVNTQDTATAPATASYVFGLSCSGGGAGTPTPSATATDEPTDDPTDDPTDEPTATPSDDPTDDPTDEPTGPAEEPDPPALLDQPRAGCVLFKDAAGDAKPGRAPVSSPQNDADLDLTDVVLRSPAASLQVYAKVAALGTAPTTPVFTGHSFSVALTIGGKALTVTATKAGAATSSVAAVKATAAFDTKASNVVFTLPKADLDTLVGGPLVVSALTVTSNATNAVGSFDGDTATGAKPEEKTYTYGDNHCFEAPYGQLSLSGPATAQFSDKATFVATLVNAEGEPVEGAYVHLVLTGEPEVKGVTDGDGKVSFLVPLTGAAGKKTLSATFRGTTEVGHTSLAKPFTVAAEKALLKAVAGKGTVTATLTDDDRTALAGQTVLFTVGSKVTKVKTNAKGVAVLSRQTKGATVKVSFAAVAGRYLAAPAVSAKVL